ncbi:FAD/NAD(P)-binding domain-containing protein [Mycena chlorophos]|uniref:FAD/NAD(P)-binding domain-containing protein n=1 Tax=Mycena chlorophos TaxID=658473 RepID=A0A8H6S0H5_MYCCL|nr:FAD/NAD(P)-binding domain-containing protein [Mycena chlorophos]
MMSTTSAKPLNIVIVGAGIGGLTTAVALRQAGHRVQVFEAAENKAEIGAGLGLQANSLRAVLSLGAKQENLRGFEWNGVTIFDAATGERMRASQPLNIPQHGLTSRGCHRADVYNELRRLATDEEDKRGPPVEIHLGFKVTSCDPTAGTIELANGSVIKGDLLIGGDGVHSIVRESVLGKVVPAEPSGWAVYRCSFDASSLGNGSEIDWVLNNATNVRMMTGPFSELIIYPIRDKTLINFAAFHPDAERDPTQRLCPSFSCASFARKLTRMPALARVVSKEAVFADFAHYDPLFMRFFDLPLVTQIVDWKLRTLPVLPTWIKNRAVIIGDAAHAMLPLLASGAAMAIEEGVALGILFPLGTTPEQVPARLEAFQALRKERGDFVSTESTAQIQRENRNQMAARFRQIVEYDVVQATREYLKTAEIGGVAAA